MPLDMEKSNLQVANSIVLYVPKSCHIEKQFCKHLISWHEYMGMFGTEK